MSAVQYYRGRVKALGIPDWDAVVAKLGGAKWQEKKEGAEALINCGDKWTGHVKALSPNLHALLKDKTGGFKEKNFNAMRAVYGAIGACATYRCVCVVFVCM